ncbi:hypothetical protein EPA93_30235 [Ktedonosporobacter rubrisoli]|uniref:Uncharacterized protein n=1 Tax=Ktedonosporobacter rubrisoli TaxID=2509675 RepID=A0A4P6JX88_KTERU|nr:hypothetical protein [Ktedonosporobacter rubrisoli]QBD80032.1 hypothetical protein EPA93_30235 [Ktedonosporobacter rubrisoli]
MSNHYTPGSGGGASSNGNTFVNRRDVRANNMTGALPLLGSTSTERGYAGSYQFEQMIESLRELFEQDRQMASQPDSTRCGICYLHFPVSDLRYRDEGFYICRSCEKALGNQILPMLHVQQKL